MHMLVFYRPRRRRLAIFDVLCYAYLIVFSLFVLFPIYWVVSTAFKPPQDILNYPPIWFPSEPTLDNFDTAVEHFNGLGALKNSVIAAGGSTVLALCVGTLAAYSMARFNTGGRNLSMWLLTQRLIPSVSFIFPPFILFKAI